MSRRINTLAIALFGGMFVLLALFLVVSRVSTRDDDRHDAPSPPHTPDDRQPSKSEAETSDLWSVLQGCNVSSVAWSPRGDRIAFVSDGIWMMSVSRGQPEDLTRLARPTRKQGAPVALFWLDNNRLGWAASHYSERTHTFGFLQVGLQDSKPHHLVSQTFSGVQNRLSHESAYGGPDDVYYDTDSQTLLFSGGATPSGVYVKILPLSTRVARKLSVPGADPAGPVTLCGSLQNPRKPEFYVAVDVYKPVFAWQIWLSLSYSLRPDKILVSSPDNYLMFPRISPDGSILAYFSVEGETGLPRIMLSDLKSGRHRMLAALSSQWGGTDPAMGCPFSWSPDGKRIAYADGSRISIVKVAPDAASGKESIP